MIHSRWVVARHMTNWAATPKPIDIASRSPRPRSPRSHSTMSTPFGNASFGAPHHSAQASRPRCRPDNRVDAVAYAPPRPLGLYDVCRTHRVHNVRCPDMVGIGSGPGRASRARSNRGGSVARRACRADTSAAPVHRSHADSGHASSLASPFPTIQPWRWTGPPRTLLCHRDGAG